MRVSGRAILEVEYFGNQYHRPVRAYWEFPRLEGSKCREETYELYVTSAVGCCLDAVLVALPIPVIWGLRLSARKKLQAIALLAVGFIATIAAALRAYYAWRLYNSHYTDMSWNAYPIYFATDIEIALGIVCVLPTIPG